MTRPRICAFTVMLPDLTPEEAAAELGDAGYEGVEWRVAVVPEALREHPPTFWGNNRCTLAPTAADGRRAADLAAAHGLAIPNIGAYPAPGDLDAFEAAVDFAVACGSPRVRFLPFPIGTGTYREAFDATRRQLDAVVAVARRAGVQALVEIHHATITPSASLARHLVEGFDPDHIGVIHDAGNMAFEGFEDYRIGLEVLGPYLAHVHVKNTKFGRPDAAGVSRPWFSPFSDGVVDFVALFAALHDGGYDGWVSVEDFGYSGSSRDALRDDLAFVTTVIDRAYDA